MVQAVPGFLPKSRLLSWILYYIVGLVTALLTFGLLPRCADAFSSVRLAVTRVDLLSVGKILTAVLIPALTTIACHESCFGLWVTGNNTKHSRNN
eukprot:578978-Amphidinium_carterae.1